MNKEQIRQWKTWMRELIGLRLTQGDDDRIKELDKKCHRLRYNITT